MVASADVQAADTDDCDIVEIISSTFLEDFSARSGALFFTFLAVEDVSLISNLPPTLSRMMYYVAFNIIIIRLP